MTEFDNPVKAPTSPALISQAKSPRRVSQPSASVDSTHLVEQPVVRKGHLCSSNCMVSISNEPLFFSHWLQVDISEEEPSPAGSSPNPLFANDMEQPGIPWRSEGLAVP